MSDTSIRQENALQNEAPFDPGWIQGETISANAACNAYLRFDEQRPSGHVRAPREVAARLAHVLYRQLHGAFTSVVAVSHSGMLEVLLAYLLEIRRIEEIGGCFQHLEGVRILFTQDQNALLSMQVSFRNQTYSIAIQTLQALVQEG